MIGSARSRALQASDPEEQRLRVAWHAAEGAERDRIGVTLSRYLWDRCVRDIEEDRKKHPKAKRNQKYEGKQGEGPPGGRALP